MRRSHKIWMMLILCLCLVRAGCTAGDEADQNFGDEESTDGDNEEFSGDDDGDPASEGELSTDDDIEEESTVLVTNPGNPQDCFDTGDFSMRFDLPEVALPEFSGLTTAVTIIRDSHGIPHVYGEIRDDVAYGVGYIQAHDRLLQMDWARRQASGRLAEIFGEDRLDDDILFRKLGLRRFAAQSLEAMWSQKPETVKGMIAFAAGVNDYIEDALAGENGARLPYGTGPEELDYVPEHWTPLDSLCINKLQTFGLSSLIEFESLVSVVMSAFDKEMALDMLPFEPLEPVFPLPVIKPLAPAVGPDIRGRLQALDPESKRKLTEALKKLRGLRNLAGGSNNWVIAGEHTITGLPMLANDPHLAYEGLNNFYPFGSSITGKQNSLGVTFPGAPIPVLGHTDKIAWGVTTAMGDDLDLYMETLNDEWTKVTYRDGEYDLLIYDEVIKVREENGNVADARDEPLTIRVSPRHGPLLDGTILGMIFIIIAEDLMHEVPSVRWTGMSGSVEGMAIYNITQLDSCAGMHEAMAPFVAGSQNFVCADNSGNIAYSVRASFPIRERIDPAHPPCAVLPGDGCYEWTGEFMPEDTVPQALNPAAGYIATANTDPWGATLDGDPLNDIHYFGSLFDSGTRLYKIREGIEGWITSGRKVTVEMMKQLQLGTSSRIIDRLIPILLETLTEAQNDPALSDLAADPRLAEVKSLIEAWDLEPDVDSSEASIFHLWLATFADQWLKEKLSIGMVYDETALRDPEHILKPFIFLLEGKPLPGGVLSFDDKKTPERETFHRPSLEALIDALDMAEVRFASSDMHQWTWGELHQATWSNDFLGSVDIANYPERLIHNAIPVPGAIGSINVANFPLVEEGSSHPPENLAVRKGANMRHIVAFQPDGSIETWNNFPGGVSGDPDSPWFFHFAESWANGEYKKMYFTREEVEANEAERIVLEP